MIGVVFGEDFDGVVEDFLLLGDFFGVGVMLLGGIGVFCGFDGYGGSLVN